MHLQGHGGAGAALDVLVELDSDRLAVCEPGVLVRVYAHDVVRLGGEHHLSGPVEHGKSPVRGREGGREGGETLEI